MASGKGPLVVLIHGFPDYSGTWTKLMPTLNDAYRVAAMDTRGYNLSDKPEGVENYEMPKLVADVEAVIQAEGDPDGDRASAMTGARRSPGSTRSTHPETAGQPRHPVDAASRASWQQMRTNPRAAGELAIRAQLPEGRDRKRADGREASRLGAGSGDAREICRGVQALELRRDDELLSRQLSKDGGAGDKRPSPRPPQIDVPVLVIHGMKDTALLAVGHNGTLGQGVKDTTMLMIPDAGHFVQQDAPTLVNRTIRNWLDQRRKGA